MCVVVRECVCVFIYVGVVVCVSFPSLWLLVYVSVGACVSCGVFVGVCDCLWACVCVGVCLCVGLFVWCVT